MCLSVFFNPNLAAFLGIRFAVGRGGVKLPPLFKTR